MPSPDNPSGRCAYLMNIYVREGYRSEGAGKKIVRYLIGCALLMGNNANFVRYELQNVHYRRP